MPKKSRFVLNPLNLEESIGARIARIRKKRGLTQKQLAEKIGIINYIVSDYENNRRRLYGEMVTRFAIALEVSTDEILGLKDFEAKEPKHSYSIKQQWDKVKTLSPQKQERMARIIKQGLEKLQAE